jgi:hypothetical protein
MTLLSFFFLILLKIFSHYPGSHKKMNLHSGMKDSQKPYSRARLVVKAKKRDSGPGWIIPLVRQDCFFAGKNKAQTTEST